jgi:hypothetical protein
MVSVTRMSVGDIRGYCVNRMAGHAYRSAHAGYEATGSGIGALRLNRRKNSAG